MRVKDTGNGDFEQPEPGSYAAICYKLIDIGTQQSEYQGKTIFKRQIVIGWELDEKISDGKPFIQANFYTASLNEKAKLRAHLEAWRGRQFSPEELQGFDLKNLLGKPCLLSLIKNEKGKIRVQGVSKLPKGMNAPEQTNQNVYFSLDDFDRAVFDGLSEGYKKLVMQSPEYGNLANGQTAVAAEAAPAVDGE